MGHGPQGLVILMQLLAFGGFWAAIVVVLILSGRI